MKLIIIRITQHRFTEGQAMILGAMAAFAAILFMAVGCLVVDWYMHTH